MTEPRLAMVLESPGKPTPDKWGWLKQMLHNLYQDPSSTPDNVLAEQIRQALGADSLLRRSDLAHISVAVNAGVATLSGHIVRAINKARAECLAGETLGVSGVVNQLVVDDELMIAVAQRLGYDPRTQGERLQVNVQYGVIYLGGAMQHAGARTAAATVAAAIPQARGVINLIQTPGAVQDLEEERIVQPPIAGAIYSTDGPVGRVQQVIINPHNRRVTAVVFAAHSAAPPDPADAQLPAERPPAQRHRLIPMQSLRLAPSGAIFLNVNGATAAHFATFNPLNFAAPPTEWQPPYPYRWTDVQFYVADNDAGYRV